jgi:hypothetical protein
MEFADLTQNLDKMARKTNQTIKSKNFPKNYLYYLKSEKKPKIPIPTEYAPRASKTVKLKLSSNNINLKRKSF